MVFRFFTVKNRGEGGREGERQRQRERERERERVSELCIDAISSFIQSNVL